MDLAAASEALGGLFRFSAEDTNRVIESLDLALGARVLDVGTGFGYLAITLALHGCRVVTGEPADDRTKYAGHPWLANAEKVGVERLIEFQAFDAGAMPFADGTFDAVLCLGSLHHVDEGDRVKVMQECLRVARAGVVICFFEPNQESVNTIRQLDPAHPDAADPGEHARCLGLAARKIEGARFDAYVIRKPGAGGQQACGS